MKKRIILLLLAACMLLALPVTGFAEETAADPDAKSGTCGDGITWVLDGYTLTVSGSGEMEDGAPWEAHKDHIEHVIFKGGITKIGAEAFCKYDRIESVEFGDALVEIGDRAFYGCEDLDYIHLPKTFRKFGAEAFRACTGLKRVYCDGGMPRFNDSCLWTGEYISVFFPTNNPWPSEYTMPLAGSYGGNMGIMMGDFDRETVELELGLASAPVSEEPEEEETKPAETEPEQTEAAPAAVQTPVPSEAPVPTEPVKKDVIVIRGEPETVPATEAPAETALPETEAPAVPEETVPETEETRPLPTVEDLAGSSWIGLLLIGIVLFFLIAGALIFRSVSRKGGRYRR